MSKTLIVNGKQVKNGKLFETDNKLCLIEEGKSATSSGAPIVDIRQLYVKDGQLCRSQKAARIEVAHVQPLFEDIIQVLGLPLEIINLSEEPTE